MYSKVIRQNGKLLLDINGEKIIPSAYMTYVSERGDYEIFKKSGYKLFFGCIQMGDTFLNFSDKILFGENEYDFSPLDELMKRMVGRSNVGDIFIMLRINLNAPKWWLEKYPEEVMCDQSGKKWMQSPCSDKWRETCVKFLQTLKEYCDEKGYSAYIAGWHLAGLNTEEWYIPEFGDTYYDFSPVGKRAFERYLRVKYKDENGLKCAYSGTFKSFEEVKIPSVDERNVFSLSGKYRDTESERLVIDYYEFCGECVADTLIYLANKAKEILNGHLVVGVFYGYVTVLAARNGHTGIQRVIDCPSIDFFASPYAYVNSRQGAYDWYYHGATKSVAKSGKLWFMEADIRTFLSKPLPECFPKAVKNKTKEEIKRYYLPVWFGPKTEEMSVYHVTKAFGKALCSGNAFWWFDMWGGWYNTDKLVLHMKNLRELYEKSYMTGGEKSAEIAVLVDEKMSVYAHIDLFYSLVSEQFTKLGFVGAPYDIYLFKDIEKYDFSGYKTILFISPLDISCEQAEKINGLKNGGRSLLFSGNACLYSGNKKPVSGFKTDKDNSDKCGYNTIIEEFGDYRVLYNGERSFESGEVRWAHEMAGGHIFSDDGDIIYSDKRYVVWTAVKEGLRTLKIPCGKKASFLIGDKQPVFAGNTLSAYFKEEETAILELY